MVATASTEKVIGDLRARAAKIWNIDAEAVKWQDGMALPAGDNAGKFEPLSGDAGLQAFVQRSLGPILDASLQGLFGAPRAAPQRPRRRG